MINHDVDNVEDLDDSYPEDGFENENDSVA